MDALNILIEGIAALILIAIFVGMIFPTLANITGQNVTIFIVSLILLGIGIIIAIIGVVLRGGLYD